MSITRISDSHTWQSAGTPRVFARNPVLQPFTSNSIWNLPIADTATFESATDTKTAELIDPTYYSWINQDVWSHSIYLSEYGDPVTLINDTNSNARDGAIFCPADASPEPSDDAAMHVIDPSQRFVHECSGASRVSATEFSSIRHHSVDLYGDGLGPQNGVRAYGGSAIGGLIRKWEIDATHSSYTGQIKHPLAIALSWSQLYYQSGTFGYDSSGYGTILGYTWPATEQDTTSPGNYSGHIPMGSYAAIPPNVDLSTLGLSSQGMMIATALQDYGAYVVDTVGSAKSVTFYIERFAQTSFRGVLLANNAAELTLIRRQLRIVTNNTSSTPNGGALGSSRRQTLLPDLPTKPEYAL